MDKNILASFLNQKIELVKNNDFVEYGKITKIHDDCIEFYIEKKGKTIFIGFDRIAEIRPLGGSNDR